MTAPDPKALARLVKRLRRKLDDTDGPICPTPRELHELLEGTEKLLSMWKLANERLDQVREEAEAREACRKCPCRSAAAGSISAAFMAGTRGCECHRRPACALPQS